MKLYTLKREQLIKRELEEVFAFFKQPENLERITPSSVGFQILTPLPIEIKTGVVFDYNIKIMGKNVRWTTIITDFKEGESFSDVAIKSPYSFWYHTHRFETVSKGTMMYDEVRYALPFGIFGALAHKFWVKKELKRIFDFRAEIIAEMFDEKSKIKEIV